MAFSPENGRRRACALGGVASSSFTPDLRVREGHRVCQSHDMARTPLDEYIHRDVRTVGPSLEGPQTMLYEQKGVSSRLESESEDA